ncbi:histidine phosphatase family protein [Frondihabitans peucedani]|uniref:phosphoglycerate mutase (2,3-diphosphoglycerate-dependent) n=1 Tax=Frondihabitans peucedani TaxID=598626 RepID=A0ABP8E246_9MICO
MSGLSELVLIRHGESTANVAASDAEARGAEVIDAGARDADVALSATGENQARAVGSVLGEWLDDQTEVWSSSYLRARQTIAIALETAGEQDRRVVVDERLRDRELGILDLLTSRGVAARHPEEQARREWLGKFSYRPPGGESWADVALRIRSLFRDLEDVPRRDGTTPHRVVVASHDADVLLFLYVCTGLSERELLDFASEHTVANASVTVLTRPDGVGPWTLQTFSDVRHLEAAGADVTRHPGERHVD